MRDCTSVKFWHDLWCRDSLLKEAFPKLFGISRDKDFHSGSYAILKMILCNSVMEFFTGMFIFHDWFKIGN